MIAMLCLYRSLQISIAVLEAAAEFVGSNVKVIFVPLVFFIINTIVILMWGAGLLCVFSIGTIETAG